MTIRRLLLLSARLLAPLVVLTLIGCEADPGTEPDPEPEEPALVGEALAFQPVSVSNFEERLAGTAMRVEIEFFDEGLTAKEVEIESADELADEEEIRSRIKGLDVDGSTGLLTLELGDLEVSFDEAARFRLAGGEDITFDEFIGRVRAALADGVHQPVKAEREPPASPAPPDDAFHATELRLDAELDEPEIEINISLDNLIRNDAPPPDGWIAILGIRVELRVSEGITEIEIERPDVETAEFGGVVTGVDLAAGTFTLANGTVVQLVGRTESAGESDETHQRLTRLAAVHEAVNAGLTVIASGRGVVETRDPLVLVALRVAFEVDNSTLEDFEGVVVSVDVAGHSFTLEDGTVIRTIGLTNFAHSDYWEMSDDLLSRVAEAVADGVRVVASGVGVIVGDDPLTIVALRVRFHVAPPPVEEFEGVVTEVDLDARTFTLDDGTVIRVPMDGHGDGAGATTDDDELRLHGLEAVARALEEGLTIIAFGVGTVESEEPLTLVAQRVTFAIDRSTVVEFEGVIASVDGANRAFTLEDGTIIRSIGITQFFHPDVWNPTDDVFERLAAAVESGVTVVASGVGVVVGDEPKVIVALRARFGIEPTPFLEFEGAVASVDLNEGTFTLEDGTSIHVPATSVGVNDGSDDDNPLRVHGLRAVAEAVEAGLRIIAVGAGTVESEDPLVLLAMRLAFFVDRETVEEFEGVVAAVDVEGHSFTLGDGTVIRSIGLTRFSHPDLWDLTDEVLARLAEAVANGARVVASGLGVVVDDDPLTMVGVLVRLHAAPPPIEDFEGVVVSVDLETSSFTLEDGTVVQLPVDVLATSDPNDEPSWRHPNLADVVEAMEAGLTVMAHGEGPVVSAEPLTILARRVAFVLRSADAAEFAGEVTEINLDERNFTMDNGTTVWMLGLTAVHFRLDPNVETLMGVPEFDIDPLALVARAVAAGLSVNVEGVGAPKGDDPSALYALSATFIARLAVEARFEGVIASVSPEDGTFTLEDGSTIHWPLRFAGWDGLASNLDRWPSLEALNEAVEAGLTVLAAGSGVVVTEDPLVIAALHAEFRVDDSEAEPFEGAVTSVDVEAKTVTLEGGAVVRLVALTAVGFGETEGGPGLLEAVARALAEHAVHAAGSGILVATEPDTFVAIRVRFDSR